MEQRPSDSQDESANELPQSVTQSTPAADQPVSTERVETTHSTEPVITEQVANNAVTTEQGTHNGVFNDPVATEPIPTANEPATPPSGLSDQVTNDTDSDEQSPTGEDLRERLNQPRQRGESTAGPEGTEQVNSSNSDRSRSNKPGNERSREGQPRPNQAGQAEQLPRQGRDGSQPRQPNNQRDPNQPQKQNQPGQDRPGQDRPGQDKTGQEKPGTERVEQAIQPRQQNGQRPGNDKPRDPSQPRQQNQSGNEKQGRTNQPGHDRPGQDRSGQDRPDRQSRDSRPARDMDYDDRDEEMRPADFRQPDRNPTGPREETVRETEGRLVIGITLGDYNGIGPEVILKALQYNRLQKICTPVIYGSMRVLNRYRNLLELKDWNLNGIQQVEQASHKLTNVITCWPDQNQEIQPGKVTPEAGQAAFACLQRAVEDLREGKLDAIVTAPINKHNIQSEEFNFPGHTEYLAEAFSVPDNLMFLVSERLRVGVVTGHVPLGKVRQNINRERILQKLNMMSQSLRLDFGIDKPRIAVLGLNPHAGEEGLLGNEEQEIVKPLIKQLQDKGNLVYGPFPADGFFGTRAYLKFDAVLAMYHDQGLIPFKAIAFEDGVNFTAAMPVVRTSPDHGTAYDIAGKNLADETSMLQAIYTACDVARRRREHAEIEAGALKPKRERASEKSSGN